MSVEITAKVILQDVKPNIDGQTQLRFLADYAAGKNKEWSKYTPSLDLGMTVTDEVANTFKLGASYTLTFAEDEEPDGEDKAE